jgi:hypothetical protein
MFSSLNGASSTVIRPTCPITETTVGAMQTAAAPSEPSVTHIASSTARMARRGWAAPRGGP